MSQLEPSTHKDVGVDESSDQWQPAGSHELRSEPEKNVTDGLNGTVFLEESAVTTIGAGPKDEVRVRAKSNGKTAKTTRKLHVNGNTLTLPSEVRRELRLTPGDEVELEIAPVEGGYDSVEETQQETINKTQSTSGDSEITSATKRPQSMPSEKEGPHTRSYAVIHGSFACHVLKDREAQTTICGESLAGQEHSKGEEPGDMLELCLDCKARSSVPLTHAEWAEWLRETTGFEKGGDTTGYFNKTQTQSIGEYVIELQEQIVELEKQTPAHGGAE